MMKQTLIALALVQLVALLPCQKRGTHAHTLEVGGVEREYLVHVPRGYSGKKAAPLVLMLHGRGSSSKAAASRYYGWVPLSDKQGFIAAFPNALGRPRSWKPAWGVRTTTDGTFLAKLIDQLRKDYKIDKDRVFVTGHSSGGIMSFSFAATHSDKVAAIGPVAGTIGYQRGGRTLTIPKPKGPVSVISIHGMADRIVAYDRERGAGARYNTLVSAPDSVSFWAKHNGCPKKPERTKTHRGRVHVDTWGSGKAGGSVLFYSIEGGSHSWPTGSRNTIDATKVIWEFFQKHGREQTETRKKTEQPDDQEPEKKGRKKKRVVR